MCFELLFAKNMNQTSVIMGIRKGAKRAFSRLEIAI